MDIEWVTIGQIRKPHGIRGHVKVAMLSDIPDRFADLQEIWLEYADGRRANMVIEHYHQDRHGPLLKFKSIDDPETATQLRGAYILVPSTETATLPEGRFYVFELIGSHVFSEDGEEIGHVRDVLSMPANDVFVVDGSHGEVLIPLIQDVVTEIDPDGRRVVVRLIPGLIS